MNIPIKINSGQIADLLRGEKETISAWAGHAGMRHFTLQITTIVLGSGMYGAAMGWWRDPQQALFVAIKFPLIILLTMAGNALINGLLAPLLGVDISIRRSFFAVLMSQTIAATILGAFSPLIAFMVWNAPDMSAKGDSVGVYNVILLTHVAVITLAGVTGNLRLLQWLTQLSGGRASALRVLLAWLIGNLFLGSQLSWILRPFIGSPTLPVEFLRRSAFQGNFYEAVFHALRQLFHVS